MDFDANNKNGTYEQTEQILDEYVNIGVKDGMYSSSTEGNFNVIIDIYIYHSKKIKYILDDISENKKKFVNINNLEILFEGSSQIIPIRLTICKVSNVLRPR